jgi:hypothetical protein
VPVALGSHAPLVGAAALAFFAPPHAAIDDANVTVGSVGPARPTEG